MSKDSFAFLFRHSKVATFHPKVPQLYGYTDSISSDGKAKSSDASLALASRQTSPLATFGLKRPIPHVSKSSLISVQSLTGPFGRVNYTLQNKEFEAFQLLRRISAHVSIQTARNAADGAATNVFSPPITSDPFFVQGVPLRTINNLGFLINIQDCWIGLLPYSDTIGIDTQFLMNSMNRPGQFRDKEQAHDGIEGSAPSSFKFRVKTVSWNPESHTAKIYLTLPPDVNVADKNRAFQDDYDDYDWE